MSEPDEAGSVTALVEKPAEVELVSLRLARGDMLVLHGPPADCYWIARELARLKVDLVDEHGEFDVPVLRLPLEVGLAHFDEKELNEAGWFRKRARKK